MGKSEFEFERKNGWKLMNPDEYRETFDFCEDYKAFLDNAKTEREAVDVLVSDAKKSGFVSFDDCISGKIRLEPGLKVYWVNRNKSVIFAVIGKEDPTAGTNWVGAHIDAPRTDFKPNPFYEDGNFSLAKTHYYGGIKKYQWVAIPLALHGVIIKKNGETVKINIGESENDPVFYISDLLPHLAQDQMVKIAANAINAEQLNVMMGSIPVSKDDEDEKGSIKYGVLKLINEKYGLIEEDFFRAEIEVVPALKARDVGLDRGLVGGYAQDDKVCAYTGYRALKDMKFAPAKTTAVYLSDKEEIGSVGNTGARSNWLQNFVLELCNSWNSSYEMVACMRALQNSRFISADVTAAFDPDFADAYEKSNASIAGNGIGICKYTGSRGKSGASDASAEFVADITGKFDAENIPWQLTEMGRVDVGGGGTIAQYMTDIGMDVLDCGVPVVSMHSPFEVTSKADVYWTYRAYKAFFEG